jgi:hypothetical protein
MGVSGRLPEFLWRFWEADMSEVKKDINQTNNIQGSGLSLLMRIFWMMIGNVILFIIVIGIFESGKGYLSLKDGIYWILVILLIITRYVDIKYLGGTTVTGLPASMSHWFRYVAGLIICAGLFWGLVHIANYFSLKF